MIQSDYLWVKVRVIVDDKKGRHKRVVTHVLYTYLSLLFDNQKGLDRMSSVRGHRTPIPFPIS